MGTINSRKRSQLQAYFAGIIDGEGSLIIVKDKEGNFNARLQIEMTDPTAIMLLYREYPDCVVSALSARTRSENIRPSYQLALNKMDPLYNFLLNITPYLLIKHEHAKVVLAFLVHKRKHFAMRKQRPERTYSKDYYARAEKLLQKITELNRRGGRIAVGTAPIKHLIVHQMREYRSTAEEVLEDVKFMTSAVEGLETRLSESNKTTSSPEKEIVQ